MESQTWITFNILFSMHLFSSYNGQILSQWMDTFQRDLCRQRWSQMDWQSLIRSCKKNLELGKNIWDEKLKTSPKWSHILKMDIKKTGEFSKIAIQSRTNEGRIKDIGGDTWRIFIRGPEFLTPYVTDLDNGAYQANFLITKPGFYKAEVILESTLCDGYKDPPKEWLNQDPTSWKSKLNSRIWQPLRGGLVAFKVEPSEESYLKELKRNLDRFKGQCGKQYQCDLLWKGFGRWLNGTWHSYLEETEGEAEQADVNCKRDKIGTLKVHGDCFTQHFLDSRKNKTLCRRTFKNCDKTQDWLYPGTQACVRTTIANVTSPQQLNPREMSLKRALKYLKNVLVRKDMNDRSALLLNYGTQFIRSLTFSAYKKLIDRVVRSLKRYKGQTVYRTTPFTWKPKHNLVDAFDNYQRTMLFNAYATSAMCQAGIPVVDVFQQSVSNPKQEEGKSDLHLHNLLDTILTEYFKGRSAKGCEPTKKSFIEKIKELQPDKKSELPQVNSTNLANSTTGQNQTETNGNSDGTNIQNNAQPSYDDTNSLALSSNATNTKQQSFDVTAKTPEEGVTQLPSNTREGENSIAQEKNLKDTGANVPTP